MAPLACAFPTESLTTERARAIDSVASLARLPVIENARTIRYRPSREAAAGIATV